MRSYIGIYRPNTNEITFHYFGGATLTDVLSKCHIEYTMLYTVDCPIGRINYYRIARGIKRPDFTGTLEIWQYFDTLPRNLYDGRKVLSTDTWPLTEEQIAFIKLKL